MFFHTNGSFYKKKIIENFFGFGHSDEKKITDYPGIEINIEKKELILNHKDINENKINCWPSDWKNLISEEESDSQILQINEKINDTKLNLIIHFNGNNELVAYNSICPHMDSNNLWSYYKDSNTHICNSHGFEWGKDDLDQFSVKKIGDHKWIVNLTNENFKNYRCNNCTLNELKDIEDL